MSAARPTRWVVLALVAATASAAHHRFRTFTGEDGLSQLAVRAMYQDEEGYLWIGTESGLNRFDGREFRSFGIRDGLQSSTINALGPAPGGGLLVGSRGGLDLYRDGVFTPFGRAHGLVAREVEKLIVAGDGAVWCGTDAGAWLLREGRFVPAAVGEGRVSALAASRGGAVWVSLEEHGGLWRWRDGVRHALPAPGAITALAEGPDGALYAGGVGVVYVLEGDRHTRTIDLVTEGAPTIYGLHFDAAGDLWVGDEAGLARVSNGHVQRFGGPDGLRLTSVTAVLETSDGFLWAGGFGGITRFVGRAFTLYDEHDGLPAANTRSVLRTRDGTLWVGTVNGLARRVGERFRAFGEAEGLPGNYVLALHQDPRGQLWVGTSRGLARLVEGDRFERVELPKHSEAVNSIDSAGDGALWVATSGGGVLRAKAGAAFETVEIPGQGWSAPRLLVARDGRVYATGDRGLSIHDGAGWRTLGAADGLLHERPYLLVQGPEGAIWFGYRDEVGFSRLGARGLTHWTTADGLSHDSVYSLGFAADGALWLGTARGVDRFVDGRFLNYGPAEGYPSTESNSGGFCLDRDGTIWFGTAEGLAHYAPSADARLEARVGVAAVATTFGDHSLDREEEVPAHAHTLRVGFDLLSFEHPRLVEMRARLVGLSDEWTRLSQPRWAVPGLGAGEYRLEVQVRRSDQPWADALSRSFTVVPPWWHTWWARAGGAVVLGLLVLGGLRLRLRHFAALNRQLVERVEERTSWLAERTVQLEGARAELERSARR